MRHRGLLALGFALAMVLSGQARAQLLTLPPTPGRFYFGAEGGWTNLVSQRDKVPALKGTPFASLEEAFDDGDWNFPQHLIVGTRGGYEWGPWSLEEELAYRHNTLFHAFHLNYTSNAFQGRRDSIALLTNLLYEIHVPDLSLMGFTFHSPLTVHIGGGVGPIRVMDDTSLHPVVLGPFPFGPPGCCPRTTYGGTVFHSDTWTVAYDGIAGVRYEINPDLLIDLDYRYLATPQITFKNTGSYPLPPGPPGPGAFTGLTYKTGYEKHDCIVSLVVRFGPPPPPPETVAPPPAPAAALPPPRNLYLVFFDWDKYNVTPEGMRIIEQAANHYRAGGSVKLQVVGFTDLSGSAGYNQRLSERRANAVADALVRLAVPRGDILVSGRGMNDPRVPTALGVREPQNRRVEIAFP